MTPLDTLCPAPFHELDDAARARVLGRLADTELFTALAEDPTESRAKLRIFDLGGQRVAIAADQEDRLSDFFAAPVAYAGLPGRVLAAKLGEEGAALLVNPGAPSEMMLEPAMLHWLAESLSAQPAEERAGPARLGRPASEVVAALADPLALRLGDMAGLVRSAALVSALWPDGARGHLVVLDGVEEARRPAIAKAVAELLAFLPPLPQPCDVAFDLPIPAEALVLRLERPEPAQKPKPRAPGSDPDKPPILRF